jgi:hypothetical protein
MKKGIAGIGVVIFVACLLYGVTAQQDGDMVIELTYEGMNTCEQQIGFAKKIWNTTEWLPIVNATLTVNGQSKMTDSRGYAIFTLYKDEVYEIRCQNETKRLFVSCQESVVLVRV